MKVSTPLILLVGIMLNLPSVDADNLRALGGKYGCSKGGSKRCCGKKQPLNILLTNDDGFDIPNIQELFSALKGAGHKVLLVAPYSSQSGKSAAVENTGLPYTNFAPLFANVDPTVAAILAQLEIGATTQDSECGEVVSGALPLAMVNEDEYYLDGPPTLSVFYGLDVAGPNFFEGEDIDLVISGPNTGNNYGYLSTHSGTIGAAVTAMNRGLPAIAFSANGNGDSDDCNPSLYNPELIAALAVKVVDKIRCGDGVTLEPSTGLSVNIPSTKDKTIEEHLNKYKFVNTQIDVASTFGYKFFANLLDCDLAKAALEEDLEGTGISINDLPDVDFPGLCSEIPYEKAGYPLDNTKIGEFNTVNSDPNELTVSVSKIQSTFQAAGKRKKGRKWPSHSRA